MTVEAAFLIPVVLLLLLILLQPGIILFDKMVMQAAAGQALRMMAVLDEDSTETCEDMVLSQLEAVPDAAVFHDGDWDVSIEGGETSANVKIEVSGELEPLPLVGGAMAAAGLLNADGHVEVSVEVESRIQPDWAVSQGLDPSSWPRHWDD